MSRPTMFAVEVATGLLIAVTGAYVTAKTGEKINSKANADIRTSYAMVQNASEQRASRREMKRIADALERAYPPPRRLPRPSLLDVRSELIDAVDAVTDMKPIPASDPDPCGDATTDSQGARYRLRPGSRYPESCGTPVWATDAARRTRIQNDSIDRMVNRLGQLPTLGGTAVDR